jgi:4-hydroxy-tetrahydrodipicolinate synthase
MVSPPFYWKATDEQIIKHYHQICQSIDIGVVIYNNHWASQVDITLETLGSILEHSNVIGLKESTHSIFKLARVHRLFANRINIFNGLGEAYEPMYSQLGSKGFTSTLGNIVPELSVQLHSLLSEKKFEEAFELATQIAPLSDFMDSLTGGQYIVALKHVLNRLGVCERTIRPPLIPLSPSEIKRLEQLIESSKSTSIS